MENNILTSKYAVIDNETIRLYNNKDNISHYPLLESIMENVSITFNDNGSINLEGDEWQFNICFHDEYPKYFNYEIHPDYIKKQGLESVTSLDVDGIGN